ncbi:MAG TPA: dihydrodipicolinate synthase family protein [Acidimicrobiales bacterium]
MPADRAVQPPPINAMAVTPFDERGALDEAALRVVVDKLAAAGVGIYLGSYGTGEGHLLRPEELPVLYAIGVEAAAGRVPVYAAAIGFTDTDRVIEQALEAQRAGVDGVQIHPPRPGPVAIRPRRNELERFYEDVLSEVRGPVQLTNQVVMCGYALPLDLMLHLVTTYDNVRALNTSDPNAGASATVVQQLAPHVDVYVGVISQLVTTLALGGAGALCYEADVAPALCLHVVQCFRDGDVEGLRQSFDRLLRLNAVLAKYMNPRSVKSAMRHLGLPAGELRRPYLPLDAGEDADIAKVLDELGISPW